MFAIPGMKVSELASILDSSNTQSSRLLKTQEENYLLYSNTRLIGAAPEAVEAVLRKEGHAYLYKPGIFAVATNVGGAAKTTAAVSLAAAMRRFTGRKRPEGKKGGAVVVVDCDSQASATQQLLGGAIADGKPVLDDYVEGKCELADVLTPVGDRENNFWVIGSNLNNVFLDRRMTTGGKIRDTIFRLVKDIFEVLGDDATRVVFDTAPQLSSTTQSIMCCLGRYGNEVHRRVLLPLRADSFSLRGANIAISELEETLRAYKDCNDVPVAAFFSSYDSRVKISVDIMRRVLEDRTLSAVVVDKVIRYSSEVAKAALYHQNIYSSGKRTAATDDYTDLALSVLNFERSR